MQHACREAGVDFAAFIPTLQRAGQYNYVRLITAKLREPKEGSNNNQGLFSRSSRNESF